MNWLRLRFGLFWTRPAWRVVLTIALNLLFAVGVIAATVVLIWYVRWLDNGLSYAVEEARSAQVAVQKYEQVVIACLRHDLVKIDGRAMICQL